MNPVADILSAIAKDPNIDPLIAEAFKKAEREALLQYRREESAAFDVPDGPDGDE